METLTPYDADFLLWTEEQARLLRAQGKAGSNAPLDWTNVAEEIESLGRSERRELASRISTIIVHLLKLQSATAAPEPQAGWRATVLRERARVADLLADSPSLRRECGFIVRRELPAARQIAQLELAAHGEIVGAVPDPGEEQVLGDWLPWSPPTERARPGPCLRPLLCVPAPYRLRCRRGRSGRSRRLRCRPALPADPAGGYHAAGFGCQLQHLLSDPEMVALISAAPQQMGRVLRPLCWMLGIKPPPGLFPKRTGKLRSPDCSGACGGTEAETPPAPKSKSRRRRRPLREAEMMTAAFVRSLSVPWRD